MDERRSVGVTYTGFSVFRQLWFIYYIAMGLKVRYKQGDVAGRWEGPSPSFTSS